MSFEEWLKNYKKSDGTCLSKTSVDHYIGGIKTISKDMLSNGVIIKELDAMSVDELNLAADTIIKNSQFIEKNKTGNNMYSGALKYYLEYRKSNCSTDELTEEQLAIKLQEMIKQYGKVTGIHLFGIKYATTIQNNNYYIKKIMKLANVQDSFYVELSKGIALAKYVTMNQNISSTTVYWFCCANSNYYNHDEAFKRNGEIDWEQDKHFKKANIGDIIFIYLCQPIEQIKYKCVVVEKNITENRVNGLEFRNNRQEANKYDGLYIKFKLVKQIDDDRLKYKKLQEHGLVRPPRSAMKLTDDRLPLAQYIESVFEEYDVSETSKNGFNFNCLDQSGINLIVYGTPGCGKSYYVEHTLLKDYRHNEEGLCIDAIRTTFYQDYSNSDFVGQIMPIVKSDRSVSYEFIPGPFALALNKAIQNENKPVALVIEELNRGNAASIFGDIFQLLDRENGTSVYNITNVNIQKYLEEQNPNYSFNYIKIPSNLSIIATMNTSDQNVYTLDTAFKRRWKFEKLQNVFTEEHEYANWYIPGMNRTWKDFCNTINNFIIESSDKITNSEDKQLGVYFVDKKGLRKASIDTTNEKDIKEFAYKVFEYLWDDVMKISKDTMFKNSKSLDELINTYVEKGQANKGEEVFVDNFFKTN